MTEYRVVRASTPEERRQVHQLRHEIFVEELKYQITDTDAVEGVHSASDEHAWLGLAYHGDTPVGTLALSSWRLGPLDDDLVQHLHLDHFAQHFSRSAISVVHKALVSASHRGSTVFHQMVTLALMGTQVSESQFLFLDCAPAMVHFYEWFGARRYAPHFYHDRQGILTVPMVLVLSDHEHLARIDSPVLDLARERGIADNPEVRAYFARYWTTDRLDPESPLLARPTLEAASFDVFRSELFAGLRDDEIRRLIATTAESRSFHRKDELMTPARRDGGIYLIADGYVEVAIEKRWQRLPIATAGPGEILGEVGDLLDIPPTAYVVALTDGVLLRFSREHLAQLLAHEPRMAALLYRNVARQIARRLRVASLWITERPPL